VHGHRYAGVRSMGVHERDQALPAIDGLLAATALSDGLTLVIPMTATWPVWARWCSTRSRAPKIVGRANGKYRQVPGLLSGAVDTSAGVVLTHPLPGGFVAPTRDGEAGVAKP